MNKTKSRNTVIITICIASALMCIALTFWGNWKNNGVLTTDAFIGVMATFIGVCATIIVGVQIVNHLELRKMQTSIKTIEEERTIILDDWSSMKGSVLLKRYQRLVEIANSIIPSADENFLEDTYNELSILEVPKSIEHYDEIMSLHHGLLNDIKKNIQTIKNESVSKN